MSMCEAVWRFWGAVVHQAVKERLRNLFQGMPPEQWELFIRRMNDLD